VPADGPTLDSAEITDNNGSSHGKLTAGNLDIITTSHLVLGANDLAGTTHPTSVDDSPENDTGLMAASSTSSLNHRAGSSTSVGNTVNATLYLGNLHPFVTETTLQEVFAGLDGITELKVIKDKATGVSAGYGFAKFTDKAYAEIAFEKVNNFILFGQEMRVNWAFQKEQVRGGAYIPCSPSQMTLHALKILCMMEPNVNTLNNINCLLFLQCSKRKWPIASTSLLATSLQMSMTPPFWLPSNPAQAAATPA